ncbi:MAG TPA: DNA primase [Bacteroidales bacterium]|nr:DNA primase [Bacteroidales bacterium]HOH22257.1 DNA primase [Bacteroidales bacterium]HPZ03696.1 DNA primase [Bacteroidales bacterium]HQB75160.1 DNA primase [Bacteroidales bacterium]
MISQKTIDEILLVSKIEEVVSDFISLKKRGQNWVGLCPFHEDRNPSMYVSPRLGIYKCFVCNAGGNAVNFVMNHEHISYPEALTLLAKKYHIPIEEELPKTPEEIEAQSVRDSLYTLNLFAENYFIDQLFKTEEGQNIALSYLKERGLNEATIKKFKIGYSPEGWDPFYTHAIKNGFKLDHLLQTGLVKKSDSGKYFDFFRGRIMFPIHSTIGKTIGFGGRILKTEEKIAKYFNSPESEIYHKSDVLYGFHLARKAIRSLDNVYIVEGYTDVISMNASGVENVVASSGTALTQNQIKLIASQTNNITILFDGDPAGIKASLRGIDLLLDSNLNIHVVPLPDGEDPDSFARKTGDQELQEYLKNNTLNFILFKTKVLSEDAGSDPIKKAALVNEIIGDIAKIFDPIVRSMYIKECAQIFQLSEETLNVQLRKRVWKNINQNKTEKREVEELPVEHHHQSTIQTGITDVDLIENNERLIILLLLKYGMYEVDVEIDDPKGVSYDKCRIDQLLFDEFHDQQICFSNPLFQKIYEEYAFVAPNIDSQEKIILYFTNHSDEAINHFVAQNFVKEDPEYSKYWNLRFDTSTRYADNNIHKLNNDVESTIHMFKLRLLEKYQSFLVKELKVEMTDEHIDKILDKLDQVNSRIEEISSRLKIVITK